MSSGKVFIDETERAWLEALAAAWSVELCFRKNLGADMFARITIGSDGTSRVEMLESFDPEDYYRQWGNRDITQAELCRFLLLHEIAHRELGHDRQNVPRGMRSREDWQGVIREREAETDRWAKERLRSPWPKQHSHGRCLIGCSGWSYDSWKGAYYPAGLRSRDWLPYYAGDFPTVEINMSFYRLPGEKMLQSWARNVPPRFVFAAKGSRRITHHRRLENCGAEVRRFLGRMAGLPQLSCILWQLPPFLEYDAPLLQDFCRLLPAHRRHAMEFRHRSWWGKLDETADILSRSRIAFVGVSRNGLPQDVPQTAEFGYFRFHGLGDSPCQWTYGRDDFEPWVERIGGFLEKGVDAYAYFNNDADARAVQNAGTLEGMLESRTGNCGT